MNTYIGKSVFSGIAMGRMLFYKKGKQKVLCIDIKDKEAEIARYEAAKEVARKQISDLYDKAIEEVGEVNAMIFEFHQTILDDEDYNESVYQIINNAGVNAEFAVSTTGDKFSMLFAEMDNDYFRARAEDVKDVSERLIQILLGNDEMGILGEQPIILIADDLTPSETIQFDKSKILAFVTLHGSVNSHTAILARAMSIPALIGIEVDESWNGKYAIVDGAEGKLIISPEKSVFEEYFEKKLRIDEARALLKELKGLPDVTRDGREIKVYANIGGLADVDDVIENDAAGIGLFRSEFLMMGKTESPTEEQQFQVYKEVAQRMAGKKVIIRTLDIGADKQVGYFNMDKEDNPAMGYRAIRICLERTDVFKTQLRALYRASAYGTLSIMFPMIISLHEVHEIKKICNEIKKELDDAGIPYGDVQLGIMIETPAAVMISDHLAKEVDFFSIGTNDLTQYTLAIDRQNAKLSAFYDTHHLAVLRMIQMVIDNGHKEGCWVGICGELGADTSLTETFVNMGIDELSVSPSFVLPIRKIIREM